MVQTIAGTCANYDTFARAPCSWLRVCQKEPSPQYDPDEIPGKWRFLTEADLNIFLELKEEPEDFEAFAESAFPPAFLDGWIQAIIQEIARYVQQDKTELTFAELRAFLREQKAKARPSLISESHTAFSSWIRLGGGVMSQPSAQRCISLQLF